MENVKYKISYKAIDLQHKTQQNTKGTHYSLGFLVLNLNRVIFNLMHDERS